MVLAVTHVHCEEDELGPLGPLDAGSCSCCCCGGGSGCHCTSQLRVFLSEKFVCWEAGTCRMYAADGREGGSAVFRRPVSIGHPFYAVSVVREVHDGHTGDFPKAIKS